MRGAIRDTQECPLLEELHLMRGAIRDTQAHKVAIRDTQECPPRRWCFLHLMRVAIRCTQECPPRRSSFVRWPIWEGSTLR